MDQLAQRAGVTAGDLELDELAADRDETLVRPAWFRNSRTCARLTTRLRWMRMKPASAQSSASVVERHPHQVAAAVDGVQPHVVALRLDVDDGGARDEPGDAAELDRDLVVLGRRRLGHPRTARRTLSRSRSSRIGLST